MPPVNNLYLNIKISYVEFEAYSGGKIESLQ